MSEPLNFKHFRDGVGGTICRRLGLDISQCVSWADYTRAAVAYNGRDDGFLVAAARDMHDVASHGERSLIQAVLMAADFAWLADELAGGKVWQHTESTSGRHRLAVAACLARID